jgi:AcrR family transcriptional regulator
LPRKGYTGPEWPTSLGKWAWHHGSLYNYVESKEALFYLLVDRGADPPSDWKPKTWPVRTPTRDRLMKRLRQQIAASFALPQLEAALERQRVPDIRAELEGIVWELYERTEHTRERATVISRSAADLPDFFQLFFVRVRRDLITRLTRYVQRRMDDGYFSSDLDPAVAGRFLLETVTTFARHRYTDPDKTGLAFEIAALDAARSAGVSVPRAYEEVVIDGRTGLVMERLEGSDLLTIIGQKPWLVFHSGCVTGEIHARINAARAPASLPMVRDVVNRGLARLALSEHDW